MKIRIGFVSNSSSTSYLVAWNKRVEKLNDVKEYVHSTKQAKLLFRWMKKQNGLYLCSPPKNECKDCEERFKCFTNSKIDELARLIATINGDKTELTEGELAMAKKFIKENEGKVAYVFRIADSGGWVEASMRDSAIFKNIAHWAWE